MRAVGRSSSSRPSRLRTTSGGRSSPTNRRIRLHCTVGAMRFGRILPRTFYKRSAVDVARELLGKVLTHGPAAGIIVETEAYLGREDLAAHSARGITDRTRVIFGPPGHAYVYFIYGMYECLNLVCEPEGVPGCVLIRALEPVAGIDEMRVRRPAARKPRDLASGPGKLTLAMGITRALNGADVTRGELVVREPAERREIEVAVTPRIGITKCAELPLRFLIRGNEFVSGGRRAALPVSGGAEAEGPGIRAWEADPGDGNLPRVERGGRDPGGVGRARAGGAPGDRGRGDPAHRDHEVRGAAAAVFDPGQ